MKHLYNIIAFIVEFIAVLFDKEQSRQLDYDNGCGEIEE